MNNEILKQTELEEKIYQEIKGKIRELYILSATTSYIRTHINLTSIDFGFGIIMEPAEELSFIKITINPYISGSISFNEIISEMAKDWPQQLSELLLSIYKIGYKHSKGKTVYMEYEFTTYEYVNLQGEKTTYNVGMFPPGFDEICKKANCDMTKYNGHQCIREAKQ